MVDTYNHTRSECVFQYRDKVGRVHRVTETGDVRVQYDGCSNRWTVNARSLTKVVSTCVIKYD